MSANCKSLKSSLYNELVEVLVEALVGVLVILVKELVVLLWYDWYLRKFCIVNW